MITMSITADARCKHCTFLEVRRKEKGKRKISYCTNPNSTKYEKAIRQRDLVCPQWRITKE